jgi:hypothetical protein
MKRFIFAFSVLIFFLGCTSEPAAPASSGNPVRPPRKTYTENEPFTVAPDRIIQGDDKEAWVVSPTEIHSTYTNAERKWVLEEDISRLPSLEAPGFPMMEALYNMALEETILDTKEEGTFMAGKKWTGVWTRDISYAIHLGLALIDPVTSEASLRRKVNEQDLVIQDTGTGGSWPVSTDRVVWSIAAWEVYKVTGDQEWLNYAYTVLSNTANRDQITAYDGSTGLFFGESSFMDWREQSYPKWMAPSDIFETKTLSTNVAHYSLRRILADMAAELGLSPSVSAQWDQQAEALAQAINRGLWWEEKGYYASFQYPNIMGRPLAPMTDSLGEALAVIQGVAGDRADSVISNMPVVHFGTPSLYPQIRGIRPYHNKGIWPFVTAYYTWAGARVQNKAAVEHGINSLTRAAGLFLSHYENMVYDNGHKDGTALNSERQLWSVAGYLSLVYRTLFGMDYSTAGLSFRPFVPEMIQGGLTLKSFPLRGAQLDIALVGRGSQVTSMTLDGQELGPRGLIPYNLSGEHSIVITLAEDELGGEINLAPVGVEGTNEPKLRSSLEGNRVNLSWRRVSGGFEYEVYKNGEILARQAETAFSDTIDPGVINVYAVLGYTEEGTPGNFSNYEVVGGPEAIGNFPASEGRFKAENLIQRPRGGEILQEVKIVKAEDDVVEIDFTVPSSGDYLLRFQYANEEGPLNTDNKCAIRTASIDGSRLGKFAFPQRGGMNSRLGFSNALPVRLSAGEHTLRLSFEADDDNMNIYVNQAVLDFLQVLKL